MVLRHSIENRSMQDIHYSLIGAGSNNDHIRVILVKMATISNDIRASLEVLYFPYYIALLYQNNWKFLLCSPKVIQHVKNVSHNFKNSTVPLFPRSRFKEYLDPLIPESIWSGHVPLFPQNPWKP